MTRPQHLKRSRVSPAVVVAGIVVALIGLSLMLAGATSTPAPANAGGYVVPTPTATSVVATPLPTAVRIPRLGVESTLIQTGIAPDGTAEVPPGGAGAPASWMTVSPRPGEQGPAVLLGHVDGGGSPGVFAKVGELRPGDEVLVDREQAPSVRFEVYRVQQAPKTAFPTDLAYGDTAGAELRLITCGGAFDRDAGHYQDNVLVLARLATGGAVTS